MTNEKLLIASAYIFGIPSLYIILTDKRKNKSTAFHATQALLFWIAIFILYFVLRLFVDLIWTYYYTVLLDWLINLIVFGSWIYLINLGFNAYLGKAFDVPYISDLAKKLT